MKNAAAQVTTASCSVAARIWTGPRLKQSLHGKAYLTGSLNELYAIPQQDGGLSDETLLSTRLEKLKATEQLEHRTLHRTGTLL